MYNVKVFFCHNTLGVTDKLLYLRRFEERNNELETQFIQLREDKADVVAFLKRTLQQRTDTIHVSKTYKLCFLTSPLFDPGVDRQTRRDEGGSPGREAGL